MTAHLIKPKLFVSYSHRDADLKKEFDTNLRVMERQGIIEKWTDGEIQPGDRWEDSITRALKSSHVIVFLVSNNFIDSDFIRDTEAPIAMQMECEGKAIIIPVLLRDTPGWKREKWYSLQALPSGVKPVEDAFWKSTTAAFTDVEKRLREIIELLPEKLAEQRIRWETTNKGIVEPIEPVPLHPTPFKVTNQQIHPEIDQQEPPQERVTNSEKPEASFSLRWKLALAASILAVAAGAFLFLDFTGSKSNENSANSGLPLSFIPNSNTKDKPFENSLGMKFVPVPESESLFSIWETRVGDYKAYAAEKKNLDESGMLTFEKNKTTGQLDWKQVGKTWREPGFEQSDLHPVVGVSLWDAREFCKWLTKRERELGILSDSYEYRLPDDDEWSLAVGDTIYPWGNEVFAGKPPGNYQGEESNISASALKYDDGYPYTSPVGNYPANKYGLFDMGGNVWEAIDEEYDRTLNSPDVLVKFKMIDVERDNSIINRGSSFYECANGGSDFTIMRSKIRWRIGLKTRSSIIGFRIVLSPVESNPKSVKNAPKVKGKELPSVKDFLNKELTIGDDFDPNLDGSERELPFNTSELDFELTIKFTIVTNTPEVDVGLGVTIRSGKDAPDGVRVFFNKNVNANWGLIYFSKNNDRVYPRVLKINKGFIFTNGKLNILRLTVKGDVCKVYCNGDLGALSIEVAPSPGDIKFVVGFNNFDKTKPQTGREAKVVIREVILNSL